MTRREMLRGSVATVALAMAARPLEIFGFEPLAEGEETVKFLSPQPRNPNRPMVQWEELTEWNTPVDDLYVVSHYNTPELKEEDHTLRIDGLVDKPLTLSMTDIKARPRKEIIATIECGGNGASIGFMGAVANERWTGTPLAPILKEAGIKPEGIEIVFYGRDQKEEEIRKKKFNMNFARSLTLKDALREDLILAYEVNGEPLPVKHGFPLRLIVPGWYGVAWVKWLHRIEVMDRRYMGRFMGRDYVTIRSEEVDGETLWRETSVTRMNVKSIVARVIRRKDGSLQVCGAAWGDGTPIKTVQLKIDDGEWIDVKPYKEQDAKFGWSFWKYEWKGAAEGEHTLVSRAIDAKGRVQPAKDDAAIANKATYWEANQQVVRRLKL